MDSFRCPVERFPVFGRERLTPGTKSEDQEHLDVLFDHLFDALSSAVFLDQHIDLSTVLIDRHDGQAHDLLSDSQSAGLCGVQSAELHLVA